MATKLMKASLMIKNKAQSYGSTKISDALEAVDDDDDEILKALKYQEKGENEAIIAVNAVIVMIIQNKKGQP